MANLPVETETETVTAEEAVSNLQIPLSIEREPLDEVYEAAPLYKEAALIAQLKRHEAIAEKSEQQLEFYMLDDNGNLQQIDTNVIFVRTGEKGGFSILPTRRPDAATLHAFPQAEKNGEHGSSFSTKHRCGNIFDVLVEVAQCYFAKVGPDADK